jgi:menaquinone-9 beta-reductase
MADQSHEENILSESSDNGPSVSAARAEGPEGYDAAIVGASLAGCAAAILLARAGVRVALVEKSPDPQAFKRVCSHYIQSSAVATLERLGLLERMMAAGALRSRGRIHTRWGYIAPAPSGVPSSVNLRREVLDPLIRQMAVETPGVELMLGHAVQELVHEGGTVVGLTARNTAGETLTLRAKLVVGADGRDSRVAKLSEVKTKTVRHGRIAYGGYFEGPLPEGAPDATLWLLDPDMAAAFPTDGGQTFYAAMPTKERLPEFKADPGKALAEFVGAIPDAPPILASRQVGEITGRIDMTNIIHTPTAPGLALVGDAAGAIDPLWGVGCGFALQSSEWLADSVAQALAGEESLERGLKRYRRLHARKLRGHTTMILDYASGRKLNSVERLLFSTAARNERVAQIFDAFGTRNIGPVRMLSTALPLSLLAAARRALSSSARSRARAVPVSASAGDHAPESTR